jgi:pimeloyl-ACP methyl ester carboxylesterase
MTITRVERVVYGVVDLDECTRFFTDFGLERGKGIVPGAPHSMYWETPDLFNDAVRKFLAEVYAG